MTSGEEIRIILRPGVCSGHARCNAIAPALFPLDDEGYSAMQPTVVPPGLKAQAREGVDACPERAILIEER
jgi:ferredoxin